MNKYKQSLASHLLEGGGGGGDSGDHGGAGEVLDGGVQEDGGHGQGGQHNQQPENLTSRLYLEISFIFRYMIRAKEAPFFT